MKRFVNHFWPFTMAALITCCAVAQADIVHITESQTIGSIDSPAEGIVLSENREYNVDGNVDYGYIGTFSGNYGLIKSGSGNMTIGYQNTYTGDTTINGGVLYVHTWNKAASELGSGTVTINQGAALCANYINIFGWGGDGWGGSSDDNFPVLNINGGTFTINGCAHLKTLNLNNGTVNYINSNTSGLEFHNRVNNVAKKISSQGTSTISTNITISDPLEIAVSDGTLTINGTINSSTRVAHTGTLTKNGAGMLVLNGLNSYNGDTYVNGGTLRLDACAWNAAGWIGSIKAGTNVYVDGAGSKLLLNTGDPMGNTGNSVANVYLSNGAVMANERPDNHSTIDAAIHFSGNSKMIAPTSGTGLDNFGHFIIDNTISVTDGTENAIENGYISFRTGNGYKGGTIDVSEGAALTITSSIYNTTNYQAPITKTGAGLLVFNALNTYTQDTYVNGGTLRLDACAWNAAGWVGSIATGTNVYVDGVGSKLLLNAGDPMGNTGNSVANVYLSNGAVMANERPDNHSTIDAAIHFSGNSKMIAPTSGTGLNNFGHFIIDNTISVTDGTENAIENGYISFRNGSGYKGGTIDVSEGAELKITSSIYNTTDNQAAITKTGAGALWLSADNTYTKATTIDSGVLKLTGSLQGDVLVKSDAALILGAYTGSGSPSLKNLTLEENGTLEIALGADAYDIVGSLTMAADSGLGLALTSGLLPVDYELLSYTSSSGEGITDNIPNQVFVSLGDGKSIDISGFDMLFWNANSLYLDGAALGAAVPEPASWLTLALGLPGLVWFWRNQRRRRGVQTL